MEGVLLAGFLITQKALHSPISTSKKNLYIEGLYGHDVPFYARENTKHVQYVVWP